MDMIARILGIPKGETESKAEDIPDTQHNEQKNDGKTTIETKHIVALVIVFFIAYGLFDIILRLIAIAFVLNAMSFNINNVPTYSAIMNKLIKSD